MPRVKHTERKQATRLPGSVPAIFSAEFHHAPARYVALPGEDAPLDASATSATVLSVAVATPNVSLAGTQDSVALPTFCQQPVTSAELPVAHSNKSKAKPKSAATATLDVCRWPCRYPACNRTFAQRQGMSRHMMRAHGVSAGSLGRQFVEERNILQAYGMLSGEGLLPDDALAAAVGREVLDTLPTAATLCPPTITSDTDIPALFAAMSIPDALPTAPDKPGSYASAVPARTRPAVAASTLRSRSGRSVSSTKSIALAAPSVPTRGKDIRRMMEEKEEVMCWPRTRTMIHNEDICSVMDALPNASSVALAKNIADHWQLDRKNTRLLRRRVAGFTHVEQRTFAKIRKLLPVGLDATAAIAACTQLDNLCRRYEGRPMNPPFE